MALAVMLILILNEFVSGMNQQVSAYLGSHPGVDRPARAVA